MRRPPRFRFLFILSRTRVARGINFGASRGLEFVLEIIHTYVRIYILYKVSATERIVNAGHGIQNRWPARYLNNILAPILLRVHAVDVVVGSGCG